MFDFISTTETESYCLKKLDIKSFVDVENIAYENRNETLRRAFLFEEHFFVIPSFVVYKNVDFKKRKKNVKSVLKICQNKI